MRRPHHTDEFASVYAAFSAWMIARNRSESTVEAQR
jgi:hypothetical protein